MGIRTVMITGDNPLTAEAIADEAGVDDFLAEATPEDKMALIKREQAGGRLVAMTGDGTNDAPALAQADVGVAMNTGTQAAKEAGNMVDLDSNPTKLIEIVEIGKQLLITRGSLTTFSIANDVAKYFAIIPAMFVGVFPALDRLNVMQPRHPRIGDPLGGHLQRADHRGADPAGAARRAFRADGAAAMLRRNLLDLRRSAASSRPSSASSSSTWSSRGLGSRRDATPAVPALVAGRRVHRLVGLAYPLVVTGDRPGRVPDKADGSLVERDGASSARALIGQAFNRAEYFHPRPSAAGDGYDATVELGVQPGPDQRRTCSTTVDERGRRLPRGERARGRRRVPVDAVTASGSGLDPHISVANARLQAPRVAAARGLGLDGCSRLVDEHTDGRSLGFLGEPGVNVLELNLALDGRDRS